MAIQAPLYSENFGFALGASQDLFMENNGCGFHHGGSVPPLNHQQLVQFDQFQNSSDHQKIPNFHHTTPFAAKNMDDHPPMAFPQCVCTHSEKQRLEFEHFINLQNERWRLAMQEKRKHQISQLVKTCESNAQFLLKQKEEEIAKATNRTMELQACLKRMEIESQTWQRVAMENEAMAAALNAKIKRLREFARLSANAAEDAESCCQNTQETEQKTPMICRCCNARNSCIIMLPCRHLCCCKNCEVSLDSCPVCRMVKKAIIEALI